MSGMLINLIIQIVSGAIGGNVEAARPRTSISARLEIPSRAPSAAVPEGSFSAC